MNDTLKETLDAVFYPKNIAVVGASANPSKLGHLTLLGVKSMELKGNIFAVNPSLGGQDIMDIPCYASIDELPEDIQLFIFAIPHDKIEDALIAAAGKGARGCVIFAGGFKESGKEGRELQQRIKTIADAGGIKIIGPNCIGTINPHHGLNASFAFPVFRVRTGGVSVVSQSGGTGSTIINIMQDYNVGLAKFVSIGNRVNLDFAELVTYLSDDPDTRVICLFIEGIDDARTFFKAAKKVTSKKPILVYQAGFTEVSRKMALSHTGSMGSSKEIYKAAFHQAGILFVNDIEEMVCTAKAISSQPLVKGPGVSLFTHTAGPSLIATEIVEQGGGKVPEYTPENKKRLREFIPRFCNAGNPLDMFAHAWTDASLFLKGVDIALSQTDIHMACVFFSSGLDTGVAFPAKALADIGKKHGKPVILALLSPYTSGMEELVDADAAGTPTFNTPHKAGIVMLNLIRLWKMKKLHT